MFLLILVGFLYVCVDFGGSFVTKINTNIQKTHQNQHKHTKDPPKSTKTYKRPIKINTNIQKTHQNQQKHTKDPSKSTQTCKRTILVGLLYVFVDFGGSFVCLC
jgi:ABC-type nickel/cobalt efflux system permease component RcnA